MSNRNTEYRIDKLPQIKAYRNKFYMEENWKGTFNLGDIIPFYVDSDVYPSDTFRFKHSFVIRLLTPIYPTMDNLVIDTYFFAVPYRLVWANFKKFMGENENGSWAQTVEYYTPQIKFTTGAQSTVKKGDLLNYMGIPIGTKNTTISALPIRAYRKIYNDFFRNENFIAPLGLDTGDGTVNWAGINPQKPAKAAKHADYFTTCLPDLQKGTAPTLPLGTSAPIKWGGMPNTLLPEDTSTKDKLAAIYTNNNTAIGYDVDDTTINMQNGANTLYTDLTAATAATLDALRINIAVKHVLEANARYGTRYTEIVRSLFGCISPDARQQRAEYLGGKRYPVAFNQIPQTSSTDSTSPQGNVSAFSLTVTQNDILFTKSFTEHTIIIGLFVARQTKHSYQQGIKRMWKRKSKFDYYWPQFANLSEQPVYNHEIYCQGDQAVDANGEIIDNQVFGYQERFAELRMKTDLITGELASTYAQPLDAWHYGDIYDSLPGLNKEFIEETDLYLKRTLAVQNHDQFKVDSELKIEAIRNLPKYGIPGIDKL